MLSKQGKAKMFKKITSSVLAAALTVACMFGNCVFANKGVPGGGSSTEQFGVNNYDNINAGGTPSIVKFDFLGSGAYGEVAQTGEAVPHAYAAKIKVINEASKARAQFYSPFHENNHYTAKNMNYKINFKFKPTSTNVKYRIAFQNDKDVEGVQASGNVVSWAQRNRNLFTIELDKNGKMRYFTGGKENYKPEHGKWVDTDVSYYSDRWNDFELFADRENGKLYAYVNGEYVGMVDYIEFWKKIYFNSETLQNCDGLIAMATVSNGNSDGWYNTENISDPQKLTEEFIYIDDLRYDYISSGFFATATVNDSNIIIEYSKTPAAVLTENISVYTSNGESVRHGDITVSGDKRHIIIPIVDMKSETEYAVKLSDGMKTAQGEELYSPYVYVTTPVGQKEFIINETFDAGYGNATGERKPTYTVASDRSTGNVISSVYRTEDSQQTSATSEESSNVGKGKALKIQEGEAEKPQNMGIAFNLPKRVSGEFSVEFDLYEPDAQRITGTDDSSWGWRLQMSAGRVYSQNDWQRLFGLDETRTYAQNAYDVFGTSTNKKVGSPYLYAKNDKGNWKSSPNATEADTSVSNVNRIDGTQNKWNHYKLDVRLGDDLSDMVMHAYVNGEDIGEWNLLCQMAHSAFVSKPQVGSIVFCRNRNNGHWQNNPEFYLDNVQVYTTSKPDSKIETADIINIENGETFGAASVVGDTAKSIKIKFSDEVADILDEDHTNYTYTDKFSLTNSKGENVAFALGNFEPSDKSITLTLNEFMPIGERLNLTIKSGLYDVVAPESGSGGSLVIGKYNVLGGYTAQINVTEKGEFKVSNLKLVKDGDTYKLSGDVKNTQKDAARFRAIIAGFGNSGMTGVENKQIDISSGTLEENKTFDINYAPNEKTKTIKGFAWETMDLIKPMCDTSDQITVSE